MSDFYTLSLEQQAGRLMSLGRSALQHWNLTVDVELTLIKHRENAVFKVIDTNGAMYALRIHRHGYHNDDALRSELNWMTYLKDRGVLTPSVIHTKDCELFQVVATNEVPEPRQCDLLSWIDGNPLGSIEAGVSGEDQTLVTTYQSIGELAAKVHNITNTWQHPNDFSRQAWDEDGLIGESPIWGRFWELEQLTTQQKGLLFKARDKAKKQLQEFGKQPDRYGLIHCDLLPENLLQAQEGLYLIDFDDSGFGWHLFEFATSMFFHLGEPHFDTIYNAMVEGYRSVRELPDEHLALLPTFFLIRGLVYLGWGHTRRETETAQTLTPMMIEAVTAMAEDFIS